MSLKTRIAIGALSLSAVGFVAITSDEGYTDHAVIPVPGDVPTLGFGTTGGVRMGDKITPPVAVRRAVADIGKKETAVRRCVHVPLTQGEYDAFVSLAYNIGETAFCDSTVVREANAERYASACAHIEDFKCGPATERTADLTCTKPNGKPKRVIRGLEVRRARERAQCEGRE